MNEGGSGWGQPQFGVLGTKGMGRGGRSGREGPPLTPPPPPPGFVASEGQQRPQPPPPPPFTAFPSLSPPRGEGGVGKRGGTSARAGEISQPIEEKERFPRFH